MRLATILALACISSMAQATPAHDASHDSGTPVDIPAGNTTLKARLYQPDGDGPFPAVIGLHGCTGLITSNGTVATRYRDWGERLRKSGFVVVFPDSYGSRGVGSQCHLRRGGAVRNDRERVDDALAARTWLQSQAFVRADHVALLGWQNGGTSLLWGVRPQAALHDDKPDFRSAVALYPGCNRLTNVAWSARIPTLILIGAADDQTSAKVCEQMVAGARGRSARAAIVVYPGAYHDFDHPGRALELRSGYAATVDGSGRFHSGTDPAGRADALKRVPAWLAR